ncbi:hypothetical protein [Cupriavidus necator]|uniref:hypothetical protein n=1 Tax=Cupriavidus necator TaxID=106590 RepID=UPI0027859EDD|nr:hypothetical protein [Cupriavidus necator]MDQ0141205.1 hypothetical protein [Cupriavidus necator]
MFRGHRHCLSGVIGAIQRDAGTGETQLAYRPACENPRRLKTLAQGMNQRTHAARESHRSRRTGESPQPHGGYAHAALGQHVPGLMLRESRDAEFGHQGIQFTLESRPEPGGSEIYAVSCVIFRSGHGVTA